MYDTIIIGAGMSGLAAGIRLAYYDQRVCILERHTTIGGLNSFYRLRGRDYDVGLHALTNFTPKGARKGPLARVLRQLRFRWDDFALVPQRHSAIAFPSVKLKFGNGLGLLESEIERAFPNQVDNFQNLRRQIIDYDDLAQETFSISTREVLENTIDEPLLREMLLCPLTWYGNAREDDMDFGQFCVLFNSIYCEGLSRPAKGVRPILKNLVRKFRALGGELKLRSGVSHIEVDQGKAVGVVLDDGREIQGKRILSSAGWVETMRMCKTPVAEESEAGKLSFTETISVLDTPPQNIGHEETVVFYNDSDEMRWRMSEDFCDPRTGVICSPNNFQYGSDGPPELEEGFIRITMLANFQKWTQLSPEEYEAEKLRWYARSVESAIRFMPDFRSRVIDTDMYTPKTIHRFTWHTNGAVYGAPQKRLDGCTPIDDLYLCGTDQGFVGIIGSIFSGISMANRHCLTP